MAYNYTCKKFIKRTRGSKKPVSLTFMDYVHIINEGHRWIHDNIVFW